MEANQISLTAIMSAYIRAHHARTADYRIFNDYLAYELIPEERRKLIEDGLASAALHNPDWAKTSFDSDTAISKFMQTMAGVPQILSRARFTEDTLEKAVQQGIRQYVILGAGLDTFAFRQPEWAEHLQVLEADHPAMQSFKRQCLAELGWKQPVNLHFIPVNFTCDDLAALLNQPPYNPQLKTLFSWLGVTMYLTREQIGDILKAVHAITRSGSCVVFDYLDSDAFNNEKAAKRTQAGMMMARQAGEPMITGFDAEDLQVYLKLFGFTVTEHLGPQDLQELYFSGRTDGYHAAEHVHLLVATVD